MSRQFGTDNIAGLVLVDGYLSDKASPEMVAGHLRVDEPGSNWIARNKPTVSSALCSEAAAGGLPEARHRHASRRVPADTAVVLIYNMIAVKDFSVGLARMNQPVYFFTYQPESQQTADYLKSKLGDKLRLERV